MSPRSSLDEAKKGSAEILILALLDEREAAGRHGYEIAKLIDDRSGAVLRFHVASLYPMLYRMERRAWIEGKWVEKAGQRRRRYYKLTPAGRKVLGEQRKNWGELLAALQRVAGIAPLG
jgi:PadR family transcriptional regulator PadR